MVDSCVTDWGELEKEYLQLEETHKEYSKKVLEVKALQSKCVSSIAHQRYRIKQLQDVLKRHEKSDNPDEQKKVEELKLQIAQRKAQYRDLEEVLPHENGLYLKIILGSVNVSLLSKRDKYLYKENYEQFKLYVTIITLVLAIVIYFLANLRWTDAAFQFLLVWYYCTLTIRESILRVNGSRIKGWWLSHHFISTLCAGIILIWPDGYTYQQFREQFCIFSLYLSLVQLIQYYYQSGILYRLRALGERHNMDITVEGFQSWMWKGLTFVLPFLVIAYCFQLYNAYVLLQLSRHEKCIEWQVWALSIIFLILFMGNSYTTFGVIKTKVSASDLRQRYLELRNKYSFSRYMHDNGNNGGGKKQE